MKAEDRTWGGGRVRGRGGRERVLGGDAAGGRHHVHRGREHQLGVDETLLVGRTQELAGARFEVRGGDRPTRALHGGKGVVRARSHAEHIPAHGVYCVQQLLVI